MYAAGELVVYGGEGVCRVEGVGTPSLPGMDKTRLYYTLAPLYRSGQVMTPVDTRVLMRPLLKKTTDKKQRAYLINHFMDQFKGTVYRQTMFAEFELAMGKMAESGQALTADALCRKYHELNKLYFGPDMVSDDQIALEWARIPHFFYNYYVFQYATGFSAAVAIANRILKEGAPAVADYKKFLSGGCSTDPKIGRAHV